MSREPRRSRRDHPTEPATQTMGSGASGETILIVRLGNVPDAVVSAEPRHLKFREGLDKLCGAPVWFRTCCTHVQ